MDNSRQNTSKFSANSWTIVSTNMYEQCIVSLTNSFVATASTNTRNAAFKIVHSDLLNNSQKFISNAEMSTIRTVTLDITQLNVQKTKMHKRCK